MIAVCPDILKKHKTKQAQNDSKLATTHIGTGGFKPQECHALDVEMVGTNTYVIFFTRSYDHTGYLDPINFMWVGDSPKPVYRLTHQTKSIQDYSTNVSFFATDRAVFLSLLAVETQGLNDLECNAHPVNPTN